MTLRARFGLPGHDRQTYLPGTNPAALPAPEGLDTPPHTDALAPDAHTPVADGTETLFDGRVTATTTGSGTASARTVFDVAGAWNSVKNVAVASDEAADLAFLGFVHVDAAVGLGSAEGSALEVVGAKRGNIATGAGADRIDVRFASNLPIWSNEFRISSGAGGDEVRVAPLDVRLERRAGDATFADAPAGAGPHPDYSGSATEVWVDLGAGDDRLSVDAYATVAAAGGAYATTTITADGGAGDDRIELLWKGTVRGGEGRDTILGGEESDDLRGGDGADTVSGGNGYDSLRGGEGDDRMTGEADADSLQGDGGADALSGGEGDDALSGGEGDDALSGGEGDDALSGGAGDDALEGDGGRDVAAYAGRVADYDVAIGSAGGVRVVTVRDRNTADGDEGTDTLTGVERLRFADRTDDVPALGTGVPGVVFLAAHGAGFDDRAALWASDGTAAGTLPFVDLGRTAWNEDGDPFDWIELGDGRALAALGVGYDGIDLWATDGNGANTRVVKSIWEGAVDRTLGHPYGPVALGGGKALFAVGNGAGGAQFWITDGTEAGTAALATATPGGGSGFPYGLAALGGGRAVFAAGDDRGALEIWATDGTAAGTARVATVSTGLPEWQGYRPGDLLAIGGGRALFAAGDAATGQELWVTDGTAAGTTLLKDINPGDGGSHIRELIALGDGRALLAANDGVSGDELWVTDGTAAGTRLVEDTDPGGGSGAPREAISLGDGRALLTMSDGASGRELWVTDGTAGGTAMVKDIHPGPEGSIPGGFAALGDGRRVLFNANDGAHGRELWVTDGTAGGTAMVKDIHPGPEGSHPSLPAALGDGRALFAADEGVHGRELWVTDGTAAGTALLKDVEPGRGSGLSYFVPVPVVGGPSWLDIAG